MIAIIVAVDKKGAIGLNNRIPWHIKSDLIRLAKLTRGHTVILGRKSYDSMAAYYTERGTRMPGAHYIVVTREAHYKPQRAEASIAHSIPAAIESAKNLGDENILVLGGGSIFAGMLPFADRIYLTEVQADVGGDAHFPAINKDEWQEVSREHHNKDERDQYGTDQIVLERI